MFEAMSTINQMTRADARPAERARDVDQMIRANRIIIRGPGARVDHTPLGTVVYIGEQAAGKTATGCPRPWDISILSPSTPDGAYKAYCRNCLFWRAAQLYQVADLSVDLPADDPSVSLSAVINLEDNTAALRVSPFVHSLDAGINEDMLNSVAEYIYPLYILHSSGTAWAPILDLRTAPQMFVYS